MKNVTNKLYRNHSLLYKILLLIGIFICIENTNGYTKIFKYRQITENEPYFREDGIQFNSYEGVLVYRTMNRLDWEKTIEVLDLNSGGIIMNAKFHRKKFG